MSKPEGSPAFPVTPTDRSGQIAETEWGMTLRDYFAAAALQGMIANNAYVQKAIDAMEDGYLEAVNEEDVLAEWAYVAANAMLEARK